MLKISIVTPCYNGASYLAETIESILSQDDPRLEYIIIDGGSTDASVDIIKRHQAHLAHWVSEPDRGMYDAIQKGFDRSTGDIMGYLNADDQYMPWTLATVREIFETLPQVDWITSTYPLLLNAHGTVCDAMTTDGYHQQAFMQGENALMFSTFRTEMIQQESTFWRRSLWEKAGARLNTELRLAGDMDLWARFYHHSDLIGFRVPLAAFRIHDAQLTANIQAYADEANTILRDHGGTPVHPAQAFARRLVKRYNLPGKRLWAQLGLLYRTQLGTYDYEQQQWRLKPIYI